MFFFYCPLPPFPRTASCPALKKGDSICLQFGHGPCKQLVLLIATNGNVRSRNIRTRILLDIRELSPTLAEF